MFKQKSLFLILLTFSLAAPSYASIDRAWSLLKKSKGSTKYYPQIVQDLVNEKLYFASIPYIKEYLATNKKVKSKRIDLLIDEVVTHVGVKQFEVLPTKFLKNSKAPMLQYILAKKYFRKAKYSRVINILNGSIPREHPAKPFALLLEGSAFSIQKKYSSSIKAYKECIVRSERRISTENTENRLRQLRINREYCIVGIARAQFAAGDYDKANLSYLDLSKKSHIWPEILFEEAWNSFYQRDYNRTLGKLVTYKAPLLKYVFNPEVEVLRALTFMELCLWQDTKDVVENFYKEYQVGYDALSKFLVKHRKDYKYYYLLAKTMKEGSKKGSTLLTKILGSIIKDPSFKELFDSFHSGREELEIVRNLSNSRFKRILMINLKESLLLQRNLIGAYVRKQLYLSHFQVNKVFQNMSYIKLEVLSRRKRSLYDPSAGMGRGRGDIQFLKRNDKQYFWNFNGEFWADELGDYVFSLKSECK
jgi:hypothetical protein